MRLKGTAAVRVAAVHRAIAAVVRVVAAVHRAVAVVHVAAAGAVVVGDHDGE